MYLIQNHIVHQNWFHQLGFMILFPQWPVTGLSKTTKLYGLPRVTVSSLVLKFGPPKLQSVLFLEHLQEFNLDLCSPSYSNFPQVSCLGMNSGRGWNPNLEGSYLPKYREYEAKFWTQWKSRVYLRPVKVSSPIPSPTPIYSECTKTYQF